MIIFYYGNDAYHITQATLDMVARYRAKYPGGLNFFRIDASHEDAATHFRDTLRNNSLFSDVKLIHLTQVFSAKASGERLLELLREHDLAKAPETVVCVSVGEEKAALMKANKTLFTYLERHAKPLKEFSLPARDEERSIFSLIDAMASGNKPLAIELLVKEMATGRDVHYLLSMITFQFRNLLAVKDLVVRKTPSAELARTSGLAPFVARKSEMQAKRFSREELVKIFSRLAELEVAAKQGLAHLDDELMNLVLRLV